MRTSPWFQRLALAAIVTFFALSCARDPPTAPYTPPFTTPGVPQLLSPVEGETLDNGCPECLDSIVWRFDWSDVPNASFYELSMAPESTGLPWTLRTNVSEFAHSSQATAKPGRWTWKVRAIVNGSSWGWSQERGAQMEPPCQDCTPTLVSPEPNAVLDNGCLSTCLDPMDWTFIWSGFENALSYHLIVMVDGAAIPLVNDSTLHSSSYAMSSTGYSLTSWRWSVRAQVGGDTWTPWAEARTFTLEPRCLDCGAASFPQRPAFAVPQAEAIR